MNPGTNAAKWLFPQEKATFNALREATFTLVPLSSSGRPEKCCRIRRRSPGPPLRPPEQESRQE
jgi:hypothetical protein